MSALLDAVRRARASGDWSEVLDGIPYARFLGLSLEPGEGGAGLRSRMRFADHLVGNPSLPALHGGTLGALLESHAIFTVLHRADTLLLPKTITITVDFLRPARPVDTLAVAAVTRQGRRVVNVHAEAFQETPSRPVATANALFLVTPA